MFPGCEHRCILYALRLVICFDSHSGILLALATVVSLIAVQFTYPSGSQVCIHEQDGAQTKVFRWTFSDDTFQTCIGRLPDLTIFITFQSPASPVLCYLLNELLLGDNGPDGVWSCHIRPAKWEQGSLSGRTQCYTSLITLPLHSTVMFKLYTFSGRFYPNRHANFSVGRVQPKIKD